MRTVLLKPFEGPFTLDYQPLQLVLCEVEGGGTRGLRREKEGWEVAEAEISQKISSHVQALNVSSDIGTRIAGLTQQLAQVRALKLQAHKLAAVTAQTEAILEDEREGLVKLIVDSARKASSRKNPELRVAFEETIRYHGQRGKKAAKTRQKNEEALASATAATVAVAKPSSSGAATEAPSAPAVKAEPEPQQG